MRYPRHFALRWHWLTLALIPLSWLYCALVVLRRRLYRSGLLHTGRAARPLIVVGNLSVGGTGKTPLVAALVELLKQHGYRPAVISRGYGGDAKRWPQPVTATSDPRRVGDEPVLLARRCDCPVVVGPDRLADLEYLHAHHDYDVIVSDDGLQHYRLARDLELLVVDAARGFGNRRCLPAGPLREPLGRVREVDYLLVNGEHKPCLRPGDEYIMTLCGEQAVPLAQAGEQQDKGGAVALRRWQGRPVHALAAIGNPERFFQYLRARGLEVIAHAFADHHVFRRQELVFGDGLPVLMTEKDAVKCRDFGLPGLWYVPVTARLEQAFEQRLLADIASLCRQGDRTMGTIVSGEKNG